MKKPARRITLLGMLSALALTLSFFENSLPAIPLLPPGAKLGLSNIVTMFAASTVGLPCALFIAVIKGGFAFLTRGFTAGIMSISGGLLSTLVMWLVLRNKKASFALTGVCGALAHNFTQLVAACFLTSTAALSYIPALIIFGMLTGILTGAVLKLCLPPLQRAAAFFEGPREQ